MPRYLLINPNTSQETTHKLCCLFESHYPEVMLEPVTARFGARYISCEASYAVAAHACVDAWNAFKSNQKEAIDGVLIACFGDPGLFALRDICDCPVTGLAESSFLQASAHGSFSIVTGGQRWKPMLERLVQNLGFAPLLNSIVTVQPTGAELQANPDMAKDVLSQACNQASAQGASAVILGGAGLAGYQAGIQPHCSTPIIDSALAGLKTLIEKQVVKSQCDTALNNPHWHGLPNYFDRC